MYDSDATKNTAQKMSKSLKRMVKNFNWIDSFRSLHPHSKSFSRYYESDRYGEGATRIDRQYHWGDISVQDARLVGVAFSDHLSQIFKLRLPESFSKLTSPTFRSQFKSKPDVVKDPEFNRRLELKHAEWVAVKNMGVNIMQWWEYMVKPGIKKLLIERGKEIKQERRGFLNLLLLRQSYLVRKLQGNNWETLGELKQVQARIELWYAQECEKIKIQTRSDEIEQGEKVRIYHHELHAKHIKKSAILKLKTESGMLEGHDACSKYLETVVSELLTKPAELDQEAQELLLKEVKRVFTEEDNRMMRKIPSKEDVRESVWTARVDAAPGSDGLTMLVYRHCWNTLGDSLTEMVQSVLMGATPTLSQRTSLMVYGAKSNKPPNSTNPDHKRRISLLNADFKINTGTFNLKLKSVSTHQLSTWATSMTSMTMLL